MQRHKIYHEFKTREWEGVTLKLAEGQYTKNSLPPRKEIENLILGEIDFKKIQKVINSKTKN